MSSSAWPGCSAPRGEGICPLCPGGARPLRGAGFALGRRRRREVAGEEGVSLGHRGLPGLKWHWGRLRELFSWWVRMLLARAHRYLWLCTTGMPGALLPFSHHRRAARTAAGSGRGAVGTDAELSPPAAHPADPGRASPAPRLLHQERGHLLGGQAEPAVPPGLRPSPPAPSVPWLRPHLELVVALTTIAD